MYCSTDSLGRFDFFELIAYSFTKIRFFPGYFNILIFFSKYRLHPDKGITMATSKTGGSTQNNRDSISKRLGIKLFDGQQVTGGEIIVRQRGTRVHPGNGVGRGSDDTLFAMKPGFIKFHFGPKGRKYVSILSH
jgi:large subunit ribosomal protein L27